MIVAIDETGGFRRDGTQTSFFVATQLRQRKSLHKSKLNDFLKWERSLPKSLKNHRGEIKGSRLTDEQLAGFVEAVARSYPPLLVTPVGMKSSSNPPQIADKHKYAQWIGITKGAEWYASNGRKEQANTYVEFSHWFKNLSYEQFMKIGVLGECIVNSIVSAFGHSIAGNYDMELLRIQFQIDKDLVKNERTNIFWHELMRNHLYYITKRRPIPLLNTWKKRGHPVLEKFSRNGQPDFNVLFWKHLSFGDSSNSPELRIADHVATIFGRQFNGSGAAIAYKRLKPCISQKQRVTLIELNDFDLNAWSYDEADNPWAKEG